MLDKKLFNCEYETQIKDEMLYLKDNNIKYTFVKNNNGINTYKYKKTPKLFELLKIFYIDR